LLIASQVIGRQLRLGAGELGTLRALGAGRAMTSGDGLVGILGGVILGSLLAVVVAVGLSPLGPIGPVRPVYPTPGVTFDWTVLGLGALVLIIGLGAVAVALAQLGAPDRASRLRRGATKRGSGVARGAANSGLPVAAAVGIGFALAPGTGRNGVPMRSAIVGAALAMTVVIATVTFGASLDSLVSRPSLYGWNWSYELESAYGGNSNIPQRQAAELLGHDHNVAAWTGVYFDTLTIDGQTVPVMGGSPNASVQPPVLSGHGLDAPNEVVLGATTLADLHKRVGEVVTVSNGTAKLTKLAVAGTATMPAIGGGAQLHLEMGTGALLSYQLIPAGVRSSGNGTSNDGPNDIFVRLREGANPAASLQSLRQVASTVGAGPDGGVKVLSVQHPAEIVNYRTIGTTPAVLGSGLAAGAAAALALTLTASVRRRRHDLALLKTLGFTGRQLAATVAWQSSVAVVIGTVAGVPTGIVLGRFMWNLSAREISAVPAPSVPAETVVLIVVGALVLANLVAAVPGRIAARTPTAPLLRAERAERHAAADTPGIEPTRQVPIQISLPGMTTRKQNTAHTGRHRSSRACVASRSGSSARQNRRSRAFRQHARIGRAPNRPTATARPESPTLYITLCDRPRPPTAEQYPPYACLFGWLAGPQCSAGGSFWSMPRHLGWRGAAGRQALPDWALGPRTLRWRAAYLVASGLR
jgi:hypothetical protein